MKLEFGADMVLHIVPENSVEVMALKYWELEFREHGTKLLNVVTEIATPLPSYKP